MKFVTSVHNYAFEHNLYHLTVHTLVCKGHKSRFDWRSKHVCHI